ncbi:MAG: hypothetical protein PHV68_01380 [Candidatus Gastranaerophilales bacterium]|nr:hypothetical protein [Candidatus Gastranaerophilales bacterium]
MLTKYEKDKNLRFVVPENQGISESITQSWTDQAIICYKNGCNCTECSIGKGNYSFVCQMPKVIQILIKKFGEPDENRSNKLLA